MSGATPRGLEAQSAWLALTAALLFAGWTLAYHAAVFFGLSWWSLSLAAALGLPPAAWLAARAARRLALVYAEEVAGAPPPAGCARPSGPALFAVTLGLLLLALAQVAAVGVSSTGLICALATTGLIICGALGQGAKKAAGPIPPA